MCVQCQGARDVARQYAIHDEIQRAEARQFVAHDAAVDGRGEMRAHAFGGDVLGESGFTSTDHQGTRSLAPVKVINGQFQRLP